MPMDSIEIPATDKRGSVGIEYRSDLLNWADVEGEYGQEVRFTDKVTGTYVASVPRFAADSVFSHGESERVIDGRERDIVQHTLFRKAEKRSVVALTVTFRAPFYEPPEEAKKKIIN